MSGPSIQTADVSPRPEVTGTGVDLIQGLFGQGGQGLQSLLQQLQGGPTSNLQQLTGNAFQNFLSQPTAQQRTFQQLQGTLGGLAQGTSPQDLQRTTGAFFDQRLGDQLAAQRESGPRFASGAQQTSANLRQRSLTDANAFFAGLQQQNIQNQLQASLAQQQLAQGADISRLAGISGAGQFSNQALNRQAGSIQGGLGPLLQALFSGGGFGTPQQAFQQPGTLGQTSSLAGAAGGLAAGPLGGAIAGLFGGGGGGGGGAGSGAGGFGGFGGLSFNRPSRTRF